MKLKHALLIPVVVGLVAYGGAKGYIYYKVKDQVDNLITMASPFVDVSYQGITSSIAGEIGVEGLRVAPRGAQVSMNVDALTLRGDGPGFLFDLLGGDNMNEPPEQLDLAVRGMRIPVGGELTTLFGADPATTAPKACSLGGIMKHVSLKEIGVEQIVADAHLGYRLDKQTGELRFRTSYDLDGIESTSVEADLNNISTPVAVMMGAMPTLRRMRMSYAPMPEYVNKVVALCAEKAGQTPQLFVEGLFSKSKAYYVNNLGFVPGQGIKQALRELLLQPGELRLTAAPEASIEPAMLAAYRPADIVSMLNLGMWVNDKIVSDLSFEVPDYNQIAALSTEGQVRSGSGIKRVKRPALPKARFIATPVNELKQYVGRDVRLHMRELENERKPKLGILVAMNDNRLDVQQRMHGGTMTVHIPLDAIERAEVFRRPPKKETSMQ